MSETAEGFYLSVSYHLIGATAELEADNVVDVGLEQADLDIDLDVCVGTDTPVFGNLQPAATWNRATVLHHIPPDTCATGIDVATSADDLRLIVTVVTAVGKVDDLILSGWGWSGCSDWLSWWSESWLRRWSRSWMRCWSCLSRWSRSLLRSWMGLSCCHRWYDLVEVISKAGKNSYGCSCNLRGIVCYLCYLRDV
jgi:hypothetical protein